MDDRYLPKRVREEENSLDMKKGNTVPLLSKSDSGSDYSPSSPIASTGQISLALRAAIISSGVEGCL